MTLASDIVQDVVEMLGVYSPGETVSSADGARGLFLLNSMLDELAGENIFVYQTIASSGNGLTAGKAGYLVGPIGADITLARPSKISYGEGQASVTIAAATTLVRVVSAIEYQALLAYAPAAGTPDTLWYNPTYPNGTLNFLPVPSATGTFAFNPWSILTSFASLSTNVTLAPGMLDALRTNLAVYSKSYFRDAQLDPIIASLAAMAKDFLRYQGQTSRAMFKRFTLSTAPQKDAANA